MLDEAAQTWGSLGYAHRKTEAGWTPVSFAQARERSREFAAWLLSVGGRPGDAMVIIAEGSPEWIMSELGLLMAGCVSVPLSIKLLEEEIPFRANHSKAKGIITTKNQLAKVLGSLRAVDDKAIRIIYLDDDPDWARSQAAAHGVPADRLTGFEEARRVGRDVMGHVRPELDRILEGIQEDDTVTISYTSGTTGNPKGIMLTHLNYWTNCHDAREAIRFEPGWKSLIILPGGPLVRPHGGALHGALVRAVAVFRRLPRRRDGNAPQYPHQPAGGPAAFHLHRPLALRQPHEEDHRRSGRKGRAHRKALPGRNRQPALQRTETASIPLASSRS